MLTEAERIEIRKRIVIMEADLVKVKKELARMEREEKSLLSN